MEVGKEGSSRPVIRVGTLPVIRANKLVPRVYIVFFEDEKIHSRTVGDELSDSVTVFEKGELGIDVIIEVAILPELDIRATRDC